MSGGLARRIKQTQPFDSTAQEALLNLFVASAHFRRKIESVCQEFNLNFAHYNILRILRGAHPEGHARCDINERMLDPSPDVTRLIDKLEEREFVQRSRSEEDRRMMIHRITDDGLALLEEMAPAIDAVIDEFDRRVSDRDLEHLNRICESVYSEYADDRAR